MGFWQNPLRTFPKMRPKLLPYPLVIIHNTPDSVQHIPTAIAGRNCSALACCKWLNPGTVLYKDLATAHIGWVWFCTSLLLTQHPLAHPASCQTWIGLSCAYRKCGHHQVWLQKNATNTILCTIIKMRTLLCCASQKCEPLSGTQHNVGHIALTKNADYIHRNWGLHSKNADSVMCCSSI